MPLYEHVFLARQDASTQQVEELTTQMTGIVEGLGGKVVKMENWGVRSLTYRMNKNRKAHFVLLNIDAPSAAVAEVEAVCADTGYPRTRFDASALAAAELLRRVSHGDIAEMGLLLAQAVPPVAPADMLGPGPELIGRVVSSRWPVGGPPEELLGPAGDRPEAGSGTARPRTCQRCGKPLKTDGSRGGRPAKYCSGACRTAAHRALHRTAPATAGR